MVRGVRVLSLALVLLAAAACGSSSSTGARSGTGAQPSGASATSSPSSLATAALPTPNSSGQYFVHTFAQAQELALFHLAQPHWVPSYLVSQGIEADTPVRFHLVNRTPVVATPTPADIDRVTLYFSPRERPRPPSVQILEAGHSFHFSVPGNPVRTTLTIAGHSVTRTNWRNGAGPFCTYMWQEQGSTMQLTALLVNPVTQSDAEHMVASMLEPDGAGATPTP